MDPPHLSVDRLRELMFGTIHLTEQEDKHLGGLWRCPACMNQMLEVVQTHLKSLEKSDDHEA